MFNSTERHYHTHNVNVVEKRAATDESVRLLREIEQAALDKMVGSFDLPANDIKCRVAVSKDHVWGDNIFHALVEINGKRHSIVIKCSNMDDRRTQLETIYNELSKKIAQIIMPDVFDAGFNNKFF